MKRIKKNSLLGLLLMTALFFTFSACDGCKNQTDGQGEEPKEEIQRPAKIITVADAKMMYENYLLICISTAVFHACTYTT